jgi:hypothetical protein
MRGGKGQGGEVKLADTETSSLKSMVWTRERIAYDLIGHIQYLIDNALCREEKLYK